MALLGLQYEPVSLNVKKVCYNEEHDISNTPEKSRKCEKDSKCCRCGTFRVMDTDVECLSCSQVEALGYFQLLDMRYHNRNAVAE